MTNATSHLHAKEYWGELDAAPLTEWLNSKHRPAGDPIEKLVRLNSELAAPLGEAAEEIRSIVSTLVRRSKLATAPVVGNIMPRRWEISWGLVGNMAPAQALALVKLIHLADKGLLGRVRKCEQRECGRWFFARFRHQLFDSAKCQQQTFRADPAWKQRHAEQMRRLRHEKKLQEQRWLKRKGKKR